MNKELIEFAKLKLDEQEKRISRLKKGFKPIKYPLRIEELETNGYKVTLPIIYVPNESSNTMLLLFDEASKKYQSALLNVVINVESSEC